MEASAHLFTLASFVFFTALVGALTWWITRGDSHESSAGYFLAGRSLTAGFIAGSLMLTNLSTEQLVGLNGAAFVHGLSVMAWEVIAAIALVTMALHFLPRFLKSGVATVPQFLELRFAPSTRTITTLIFIGAYAAILLPIILYTGATGMSNILNLKTITGIESYTANIWIAVWIIGLIGSVYAIFGGLRSVAVSDTLNGFGLLLGGVAITWLGFQAAGDGQGVLAGYQAVKAAVPEKFNSISGPAGQVPFFTLFTGVLVLNLFYWCTNQQIIQRTFGASSLAEGQKGVLLAGGLKVLGPLILVFPGLIACALHAKGIITIPFKPGGAVLNVDTAYGLLVQKVMPGWMTGFFAAVLMGAILSSFNSALNSTCTLFSLGVYKGIWRKDASEADVIRSGKVFGWAIAVISMTIAPLLLGQESIFGYLQTMNAIYFIPIFAVVMVGLLTRRVPARAANIGLVFAFVVIVAVYFIPGLNITDAGGDRFLLHNFHFITLVLMASIALMLGLGALAPRPEPWVHVYSGDVDLTPWKHARATGVVLVVLVLLIYGSFADFSVIRSMPAWEAVLAAGFAALCLFAVARFRRESGDTEETAGELSLQTGGISSGQ